MSTTKTRPKLILIDGHSLAYRAYFAMVNTPLSIENASGENFVAVLAAVRASGALAAAHSHGVAEAGLAKAALAALPDSKFRETLLQLADFAVQRRF